MHATWQKEAEFRLSSTLKGYKIFLSTGAFHMMPIRMIYTPITMRLATSLLESCRSGGTPIFMDEATKPPQYLIYPGARQMCGSKADRPTWHGKV